MNIKLLCPAALLISGFILPAETHIAVKPEVVRPVERRIFGTNQIAGVNRQNRDFGGRNQTYDLPHTGRRRSGGVSECAG